MASVIDETKLHAFVGKMLGVRPDDRVDVDESELLPLLWEPKGASPNAVE